jgi:zinc D-Ala-D-Ala carboxypeptidase
MIVQKHWRDVRDVDWPWPNFTPRELAERSAGWEEGSSPLLISPDLMNRLQELRERLGRPLPVSSGYRSPGYNAAISRTGFDGPHTTGMAVDVSVYGETAFNLIEASLALGFTGLGIRQKGPHASRFIHLDCLSCQRAPRPRVWSY